MKKCQDMIMTEVRERAARPSVRRFVKLSSQLRVCSQLTNAGDDVVVFYNDKASFKVMLDLMAESREGVSENSPLR